MSARAELIEDGGAAALSAEFFRSREFLAAEGVTHTLRIEGEVGGEPLELVAPVVVREIDAGPERDAVSPYSYPGIVPAGAGRDYGAAEAFADAEPTALDPAAIDFSATGLVSLFLRHRLGPPALSGSTPRNLVQIADPTLPEKSRPSDRRQVRRNLEAGYELRLVPGTETTAEQRAGFLDVYEQTMRRTEAAPHYFFGAAYFDRILAADRTWLALAHAPDGALAAASIAVVSDGFLHYYLSGSDDAHLRDSPMKNVVARLAEHAAELELPLNLGGGITPGDALEEFKRGFANRSLRWHTSEIICDPERYAELSGGRAVGGYFPAYRAP
ncbi:MAG: GNAT family N-acetyltransferase [Solirubrobacterales bacterium]